MMVQDALNEAAKKNKWADGFDIMTILEGGATELQHVVEDAILLYHTSQKEKETDAVEFAQWLLDSDWQMQGDVWVIKAGNYVHGIIQEQKSTFELYEKFKSTKS